MGICTSDPLTYLIKQYGGDVCKYIVAEQTEEFIDDTAPKIKDRAKEQIDNSKKEIRKSMDQNDKKIDDNFKNTVDDLNKSDPNAISAATKSSGKSTQQLFGLDKMKNQVGKIKSEADKKIDSQSETIMKQIEEQKQRMKKQVKDSKPKLPLYQNMPICLKQKVLGDGKQKFSKEIKSSQEGITNSFEKAINLDGLSNNLKSISGADRVGSIADDSKSAFDKAKKVMTIGKGGCFG